MKRFNSLQFSHSWSATLRCPVSHQSHVIFPSRNLPNRCVTSKETNKVTFASLHPSAPDHHCLAFCLQCYQFAYFELFLFHLVRAAQPLWELSFPLSLKNREQLVGSQTGKDPVPLTVDLLEIYSTVCELGKGHHGQNSRGGPAGFPPRQEGLSAVSVTQTSWLTVPFYFFRPFVGEAGLRQVTCCCASRWVVMSSPHERTAIVHTGSLVVSSVTSCEWYFCDPVWSKSTSRSHFWE